MRLPRNLFVLVAIALGVSLIVAAVMTRNTWQGWLFPQPSGQTTQADGHKHGGSELVHLSPQAVANLKLILKPVRMETYWRTLPLPGKVVERPGKSERGVSASIAGVVRRVNAVPGDTVRPGGELFTLQLVSEYLQNSQTELYKTAQETQITLDQKKRLEGAGAVVASGRLLEFDYQLQRLGATNRALRQDLAARGLTPAQIEGASEGKFVREITVRAPVPALDKRETEEPPLYEVEELKVQLGEQVQAGQVLCTLANHQALYIEGRVFKQEVPLIERAVRESWPVRAEITESSPNGWAALDSRRILFIGNHVDPASQTVPIYLPLVNEHREHQADGRTYRIWRFRPGQRVRLEVPDEKFDKVFVVPIEAVVREGAEAYIFRQNGDSFDRKPVHVVYEDRLDAILGNDSGIFEGNVFALKSAAALNRGVRKAKAAGGEDGHGHSHDHAGHSHEH